MKHVTTAETLSPEQRWGRWVDELLVRLGWTNTELAKALGSTVGTVGTWRRGANIASAAQIIAMLDIPEVSELVTIFDAYLAAGILREDHMRTRHRQTRSPLYEYSLSELTREVHERVSKLTAVSDNGNHVNGSSDE